jgi:hypothetical protein
MASARPSRCSPEMPRASPPRSVERRRHRGTASSSSQQEGSWGRHRPAVQRRDFERTKNGCLTCRYVRFLLRHRFKRSSWTFSIRVRSKKCPDGIEGGVCPAGPCEECDRLGIECLGYADRYPTWLKVAHFHMVASKACLLRLCADFDPTGKQGKGHQRYERLYEGVEGFWRQVLFLRTRASLIHILPSIILCFRMSHLSTVLRGDGLGPTLWDSGSHARLG